MSFIRNGMGNCKIVHVTQVKRLEPAPDLHASE